MRSCIQLCACYWKVNANINLKHASSLHSLISRENPDWFSLMFLSLVHPWFWDEIVLLSSWYVSFEKNLSFSSVSWVGVCVITAILSLCFRYFCSGVCKKRNQPWSVCLILFPSALKKLSTTDGIVLYIKWIIWHQFPD